MIKHFLSSRLIFLSLMIFAASFFFSCATTPIENLPANNISIEGYWDQYVLSGKEYAYNATFSVEKIDGIYVMQHIKKRKGNAITADTFFPDMDGEKGMSGISYKDGTWKFKSGKDIGDSEEFILTMNDEGSFEGWSFVKGEKRAYNLCRRAK